MKKYIKNLRKRLAKIPRPKLPKLPKLSAPSSNTVCLAVILGVLAAAAFDTAKKNAKTYQLTLLGPMGPVAQLIVNEVSHQEDGAICFRALETGTHGCLKFGGYELSEVSAQ